MNDLERVYFNAAFAAAYPEFVAAEQESLDETAGKAMTAGASSTPKPPAPKNPDMTAGDVGTVIMDTLAGLMKGASQASVGVIGDVETLVRIFTGGQQKLLTTEDLKKLLPQIIEEGRQADPRRRATVESSETVGEFMSVAPIVKGAVKGAVSAAKRVKFGADGKRLSTQGAK